MKVNDNNYGFVYWTFVSSILFLIGSTLCMMGYIFSGAISIGCSSWQLGKVIFQLIKYYKRKKRTYYWVGGSGNWSDLKNSKTSSGKPFNRYPNETEEIYLDGTIHMQEGKE